MGPQQFLYIQKCTIPFPSTLKIGNLKHQQQGKKVMWLVKLEYLSIFCKGGGSLLYFYQNSWSPHMGYVCTYKKDSIIYAIVWFPIKLTTNWWYYELMLYTYSLSFPSSSFCWNIFFRISIVLVEVVKLDCFLETINFHQNREQKFRK